MKKRLVFHIGMPKTGTTFLQRNVFPYIKGINYYNCIDNKKGEDSIRLNPFYIQFGSGTNLISDERICGLGYLELPQGTMLDRLKRLHKVYPKAEIIFVTRKEEELLVSLYKQYAKYSYGTLSFKDWIKTEADTSLIFGQYRAMSYIFDYFENSLIIDYSILKRNKIDFIDMITDFLGAPRITMYKNVKENVSPSHSALMWIRYAVRLPFGVSRRILIILSRLSPFINTK